MIPRNKLLFLCTGNYYRSRFAEELFNHLAAQKGLDWVAASRGLAQEFGLLRNLGHMSSLAVQHLENHQVKLSPKRSPRKLQPGEAREYQIIIALNRDEHEPLIAEHYPELSNVVYWDIKDLGDEPAAQALGRLEGKIETLVAQFEAERGH